MPLAQRHVLSAWPIALLAVAVIVFTLTGGTLQWVRTDLDPLMTPLSLYLKGPGGACLRGAYYLMGGSLAGLAWISHRATATPQRSGLASALLIVAALALPVVAITALFEDGAQANLARFIHGEAAQATFLCLVVGMLLLSCRWRRDPRLHHGHRFGLAVAWLAFVQMWVLALWRGAPPGLTQKALIALILLWLGQVAWRLWRATRRA